MKTIPFLLSVLVASMRLFAGVDDTCISFSTTGPDRYADGTVVLDGECYALVWSEDGKFDGFAADGTPIDAKDRIVLCAPVARNGRCPRVLFQISAAQASELSVGRYAIYLLDTRVSRDGTLETSGFGVGTPALVNGSGAASVPVAAAGADVHVSTAEPAGGSGVVAETVALAPAGRIQPRIKGMKIEGDKVFLTVENLKGYMRVQSGPDISAPTMTGAATTTSGGSEDVILVAPKSGSSGFYKVIRN